MGKEVRITRRERHQGSQWRETETQPDGGGRGGGEPGHKSLKVIGLFRATVGPTGRYRKLVRDK
jgi:hypothetical protein